MLHIVRMIRHRHPDHASAVIRALMILGAALLVAGIAVGMS